MDQPAPPAIVQFVQSPDWLGTGFYDAPLIRHIKGKHLWRVEEDCGYKTLGGSQIIVPKGFITDYLSIPQAFWRLLPPEGDEYDEAGLVHDFLYASHPFNKDITKGFADRTFLEAMERLGVGSVRRYTIYKAVALCGGSAWREHEQRAAEKRTLSGLTWA